MMDLIEEITERMKRLRMLEDLLHAVVERTGMQREGYYSLRKLNDLTWSMNGAIATSVDADEVLRHMDNLLATLQDEVNRIEAMA